MRNLRCWWFGCEPHPEDPAPIEHLECMHCGELMDYEGLVGITRYRAFKEWCRYWFFRKWWPVKCEVCGKRWRKCQSDEEHFEANLPF